MFQDIFSVRGRGGFSTVKPFQMKMPEIRQQEEEPSGMEAILGGIMQSVPGIVGAMKEKKKKAEPAPVATENSGVSDQIELQKPISEDDAKWDAYVLDVDQGIGTRPFLSTPGWEAAQKRRLNRPTFAGMFAHGGRLKKDQWGIVGEEGPEIVKTGGSGAEIVPLRPTDGFLSHATPDMMFESDQPTTIPPTEDLDLLGPANRPAEQVQQVRRSPLEVARGEYEEAVAKKPGKEKWWKDALVKTAQIISNTFNPQNQVPVQGWGAMKRDKDIRQAQGRYAPLQQIEDKRIQDQYKQKQIENIDADNRRQQEEVERKKGRDAKMFDLQERTLDWKKEDRDRYYELEDIKLKAKEANNKRVYDLALKKQEDLIANNEANRNSREKIAGMRESGVQGRHNEKLAQDRQKFIETLQRKVQGDKLNLAKYAQQADAAFNKGEMDKETYDAVVRMIQGIK